MGCQLLSIKGVLFYTKIRFATKIYINLQQNALIR